MKESSQAIALVHRDEIIAQVANGEMLKAIAAKLGISPAAVSNQLHDDPEYRKAREIGAEIRLEEQFIAITKAQEQESVSRAREGFRAAAWFAEREFPHRWGQRTQVSVTVGLSEELQKIAERKRERLINTEANTLDVVDAEVMHSQHDDP